jgi:hypothetical protein
MELQLHRVSVDYPPQQAVDCNVAAAGYEKEHLGLTDLLQAESVSCMSQLIHFIGQVQCF